MKRTTLGGKVFRAALWVALMDSGRQSSKREHDLHFFS